MARHAGIRHGVSGGGALPQRPRGRRRRENAAVRGRWRRPLRRLPAGGGGHGAVRGGIQRLYAQNRGGAYGRRLRRAAGGADAAVPGGNGVGGADSSGTVYGLRHRCRHRVPRLHCRRGRRLSGGDWHRLRHGGGGAGFHSGGHGGADRPRGGHGSEESAGAGV